jgi:protease-4
MTSPFLHATMTTLPPAPESAQPTTPSPQTAPAWERETLEKLLMETLVEQRRRRRWGIFFKLLALVYLGIVLLLFVNRGEDSPADGEEVASGKGQHTALVSLEGVISEKDDASAANVIKGLRKAFADAKSAGVVLRIDSPGGSPVQAGLIYDEIRRLRTKYPNTPLVAVVEDLCASGGYYVAAAADQIIVDRASLVGSIGVLINGFGFVGALDKLGVERRLLTAGNNKGFLDPFSPQNADQKAHAQSMLADIHQQFIRAVKAGRGNRLKESPALFSGLMWTGEKSVQLGLADALGSVGSVARDMFHAERVVDYTHQGDWTDKLSRRFAAQAGVALREELHAYTWR